MLLQLIKHPRGKLYIKTTVQGRKEEWPGKSRVLDPHPDVEDIERR